MSLSNIDFSSRDKNILFGNVKEEEAKQGIDADVYTLNVCKNGQPDTLKIYGPKGQES